MVVLKKFSPPTEGIRHLQRNTTAYVNDNNLGKGTVIIAECYLTWISDSGHGFSVEYRNISLHAVSRDLTAFPRECLFLMIDTPILEDEPESNGNGGDADDNDGSDDSQVSTELRLVPDDRGMLDAMFHAINACHALHPDPVYSDSDETICEDTDEDIELEETDSRMANLSMRGGAWDRASALGNNSLGLEQRPFWGRVGEDRVVDMQERVGGRVVDMEEEVGGNRVGEDMEEEGVGGRVVDMQGEGVADLVQGSRVVEDMEEGMVDRVQDGRPFHLGSTQHQDNSAALLQVHSSRTASHFSDVES